MKVIKSKLMSQKQAGKVETKQNSEYWIKKMVFTVKKMYYRSDGVGL